MNLLNHLKMEKINQQMSEILKQNIEIFIKKSNLQQTKENRLMFYKLIEFAMLEGKLIGIQEALQ